MLAYKSTGDDDGNDEFTTVKSNTHKKPGQREKKEFELFKRLLVIAVLKIWYSEWIDIRINNKML